MYIYTPTYITAGHHTYTYIRSYINKNIGKHTYRYTQSHIHAHRHIYIHSKIVRYTYIQSIIYIVIHRQTVSFYQNSSVWLDTQDARSRNPSNFTID